MLETRSGSCDIKVWSKECEHATYESLGDKYLCDFCEALPARDHEVKPATMPYVSGDYSRLG